MPRKPTFAPPEIKWPTDSLGGLMELCLVHGRKQVLEWLEALHSREARFCEGIWHDPVGHAEAKKLKKRLAGQALAITVLRNLPDTAMQEALDIASDAGNPRGPIVPRLGGLEEYTNTPMPGGLDIP